MVFRSSLISIKLDSKTVTAEVPWNPKTDLVDWIVKNSSSEEQPVLEIKEILMELIQIFRGAAIVLIKGKGIGGGVQWDCKVVTPQSASMTPPPPLDITNSNFLI